MSRKRKIIDDSTGDSLNEGEDEYLRRISESIENQNTIDKAFQLLLAQMPESDREELWERVVLRNGLLECQCCFDDLSPDDAITCPDDHFFCRACFIKQCEGCLADARGKVGCMTECNQDFTLATIEASIPKPLFDRLLIKLQSAELAAARIDGLEGCPFCDYAYIPEPDAVLFNCLSPQCLKKSCRSCKELSHIPVKCKEVERPKDEEVRRRIEEKMSAALYRTCPKCKVKFIKSDGCNVIRCGCGAVICYYCGKLFNDNCRCPHSSSIMTLHNKRVKEAGVAAKNAELAANPDVHLVHDPTSKLEPAKKRPRKSR